MWLKSVQQSGQASDEGKLGTFAARKLVERPERGCKKASYKVTCAASRLGHEYAIVKVSSEEMGQGSWIS